jgi:4-amino-4-deoxy-L-arabinose transferase-like glycosyltransferase
VRDRLRTRDARPKTILPWLPWLFPLGLPVAVFAVAFAPTWLIGILGLVALALLGYGGVPLYWRLRQGRGNGNGDSH